MSIQQIDRGTAGNPSDRFKIGTALDTVQANDEYLDYVNTVAGLALLSLSVGDIKRTKGCLSVGDGGHGTFIVEAASGTPDGYSRILLANGNHAVLQPPYNVKNFGVDSALSSSAFQRAIDFAYGSTIFSSVFAGMPNSLFSEIDVPIGSYNIDSSLDYQGKDITWNIHHGADIDNVDSLGGRVNWGGTRINTAHYGILDHACGFAVSGNRGNLSPAGVMGITHPNQLAAYTDRDSVGLYYDNASVIPFELSGCTFTSTTLVYPSAADTSGYRVGMIIDTDHSPNKYSGVITGWSVVGSTTTITVSAWYECTGVTGTPGTPPSPATAYVNAFTKVWGGNSQTILSASGLATRGAGFEMGLRNNKSNPSDPYSSTEYMWGHDVVNLGVNNCTTGYIQRGAFLHGFESRGALLASYVASEAGPSVRPPYGFLVTHQGSAPFAASPNGDNTYSVASNGDIVVGSGTTGSNRAFRMRSSGLTTNYDSRILSVGGTASDGQGTLRFTAQFVESQGRFRPNVDNTHSLGDGSTRWTQVYAASGTINTSDRRSKTEIRLISNAERAAALELKSMLSAFKYSDAVQNKGEDARIHFGVIAQDVISVFESHGLDANKYGLLCYDSWDDVFEDEYEDVITTQSFYTDEGIEIKGEIVTSRPTGRKILVRESGNRYGVRYDELLALIISAM